MKSVIALLLLSVSAFAETNTVYFTNRFATFTNLEGKVYDHVELVKMDTFTIMYLLPGGGGRVYLTNLAPSTLKQLGLATNLISEATKLDKELAAQKALSEAEEQARMRDPKNWRDVHVRAVFRWWGDRLECQISELSKHVLVRRPPADMVTYFNERGRLVGAYTSSEAERQRVSGRAQQLAAQINTITAQIKQRQYQLDMVDANTATGAGGNPAYVDAVMRQRAPVNMAQVNLSAAKDQLETLRNQLSDLQGQIPRLQEQVSDFTTQIKELDAQGAKAATIKVFITSKKYNEFPILEFTGN